MAGKHVLHMFRFYGVYKFTDASFILLYIHGIEGYETCKPSLLNTESVTGEE